jgi:hypothetical protein
MKRFGWLRGVLIGVLAGCALCVASPADGAGRLDAYYAHETREDEHGVIAPWHQGQNGQLDERLRLAVEVYRRYPWVGFDVAVQAAPDFVYNSHWTISEEGEIGIPPTTDWMCGDLSQRVWSIVKGLTDYYRYSGDPIAFTYIPLAVDYVLDYGVTSDEYEGWPRFPISNPTSGKIRGQCLEDGRIQLDLVARLGLDVLLAYKLTGNPRYYEAACHWGDLMARHCNLDGDLPPWNRYANPWVVGWSDKLTGTTAMICEFLDALIEMGHTGDDDRIVKARDAGRRYLKEEMLPNWTVNEVWGRNYWDWDNPVTSGIVSMCGDYFIQAREAFPRWRTDMRNVLSLIFNRNGVDPGSMGDTYSGAWAFPESSTCCWTSLSYCQYTAAPTFLRHAYYSGDAWSREIGRRMMLMATYDSDLNGVVLDGLEGRSVATWEWSNLAHPWPLCQIMEAMRWAPELFAPSRENHIVNSTSVVNFVDYSAGRIEYTTFDAGEDCVDVLRLAFVPTRVAADGERLELVPDLARNGYEVEELGNGDAIVRVRHDGRTHVLIEGEDDPQQEVDATEMERAGSWRVLEDGDSFGGRLLVAEDAGATATYVFRGNQVRLMGYVGQQGGWADVYLNGERQNTLVECWSPRAQAHRVLYSRSGLDDGTHELRIVARGEANPLSGGTLVTLDSVQFSDATGSTGYGSGGGPTDAQRMIFGYVEREDYIDGAGNAWRPATEWVIRSGYGTDSVKEALWTERRTMWIGGTEEPELYRYGIHGGEFWLNATVGPGEYDVRLHFAATPLHWFLEEDPEGGMMRHIMAVEINGERVIERMDVAAEAGGNFVALQRTFEGITPRHGIIEVRCIGLEDREAILQAVEILPRS